MTFKIGDRVRVKGRIDGINGDHIGRTGTIVYEDHDDSRQPWAVQMDVKHTQFHSCSGQTPSETGVWVNDTEIELMPTTTKTYKFKVGQKVRITKDASSEIGPDGIIDMIDENDDHLTYKVCDLDGDDYSWFTVDELEAIESEKQTFIVVKRLGINLFPANIPYIHTNREEAEKEALRLADQNNAYNFVVLQVVSEAINPTRPSPELKKVA